MQSGVPSVIDLADDDDPIERGVVVHHERHETPSYAHQLASLARPEFPVPVGVIREVEKPCYETMLTQTVEEAIAKQGPGDLHALLNSGDTWRVD